MLYQINCEGNVARILVIFLYVVNNFNNLCLVTGMQDGYSTIEVYRLVSHKITELKIFDVSQRMR